MQLLDYKKNKTTELFRKLDKLLFFCSGMNYWVDDIGLADSVLKAYRIFSKLMTGGIIVLIIAQFGSFFTQSNLTEKQKSDQLGSLFPQFMFLSFTFSLQHHRKTVTEVLYTLAVELKKDFNDEETERLMLKRTRFLVYACAAMCINAAAFTGITGLLQVISDGNFVTVITVWPDVHDNRTIAGVARVGIYVGWWLWVFRIIAGYLVVLPITISLSHQYKNLQLYFKSIAGIFEEKISQSDKEEKFEKALNVGIRLHVITIRCTQQLQKIGSVTFSAQIIVNITVIVLNLLKFQHDRTMGNILAIVANVSCILFMTAFVMLSAGNITVEAANLPTAIFQSGWENCSNHSSFRIRRMLLIAITQSQKPVVITCLGFISLSYESFVSIVKTSYSVFSFLY